MVTEPFKVNETWVAYKLTKSPVLLQDGRCDVHVVMDAASQYIIGVALAQAGADSPPVSIVESIFAKGELKHPTDVKRRIVKVLV